MTPRVIAALLLLVGACAGSDEPGLPPVDAIDAEYLLADGLAEFGVRLTNRGGLIDRSDGYEKSPEGDHYALYVELLDVDATTFAENLVPLAAYVGPLVMAEFPGLATYDICQQAGSDERVIPATQIFLTRAQVESADWSTMTVEGLYELAATDDEGKVWVHGEVADVLGDAVPQDDG